MNKISKKIVSAVTMAAFVLTLIPAAAFAAVESAEVTVDATTENIVLDSGKATADLTLTLSVEADAEGPAYVWLTKDDSNDIYDASYTSDKAGTNGSTGELAKALKIGRADVTTGTIEVAATVTDNGVYTAHVGYADSTGDKQERTELQPSAATDSFTVYPAAPVPSDRVNMTIAGSEDGAVDATTNDATAVNYTILDAYGNNAMMPAGQNLYIWASAASSTNEVATSAMTASGDGVINNPSTGLFQLADPADSPVNVTFTVEGSYVLNLGYGSDEDHRTVLKQITVNVTDPEVVTTLITFDEEQGTNGADGTVFRVPSSPDKSSEWVYTINDEVIPNNVKEYTITGVAYETYYGEGNVANVPAANQTYDVYENEDDFSITSGATVKTNDAGEFSLTVRIDDPGSYDLGVYSSKDQVRATLTVKTDAVAPKEINTIKEDGVLLAGNDKNYMDNTVSSMADAIQFEIIDTYGHEQTDSRVIEKEDAAVYGSDAITLTNKPDDSTLGADNLKLIWDDKANAYTLQYNNADPAKDLVAGDYTVEVSLNNGEKAKASFTVANFGEIEELTLDLTAEWRNDTTAKNDSITVLDEQVALGQRVIVEPMYVDANGLKIKADDVVLTAEGAAVESRHLSGAYRYFDLFWNIPSNQSLIGTVVTVQAYDETNHNYVERELTVVDAYQNETLAFDPTQGEVGESNTVNVTVEANDAISKVNGTMSAYIASQSNEEATIDLDVQKNVVNGEGKLFLQSDAEGTVDVVVAVKANNGEIYANTLTFTFGDEDPYAGSYIVMTIGSDQYLINGEMFDGSVDNLGAPYVDSAWRTMVPVRVLAESFGANVDYADNVVTIVDGDTTVVMNIGEETYTVNGEEKAMDTAAVIGDDDRTYVPVRFVAEALGYSVTPLYDANGLTSSVHFSK